MENGSAPQITNPNEPGKKSYLPKIIALVVIIIAYAGFVAFRSGNKPKQTETQDNTQSTEQQNSPVAISRFKNGSYEATGTYTSPAGPENIKVVLTLTDDMVTAVEVTPQATNPISQKLQADFAANYKVQVVGKDIESLQLLKVSGSSLTPKGFNDALEKIRAQAKS